jgi:acyl-CoA thioester hydrolase
MTRPKPSVDQGSFTHEFSVDPADIDELDHVNNVVYVRWVQEVAAAHWSRVASVDLQKKCKWVVLRHEIDYHSPAHAGEKLNATTWVDAPEGPLQRRYVIIERENDGKRLAEASTTWCLLDSNTGKPRRISQEIISALSLKN